ncbi:MAG: glycosyltransferase family 4 protein, partial [bacterium]|nr:glycosyltransferase family 4 protein [bacterium]
NIKKNKFNNLLFFSNIRPEKGIFEFLELARYISNLNINVTFTIAGPVKDKIVEGQILNYISKYKISNISILGPMYDKFGKENLFSNSGVLIFPSHAEALPLVIIEAFSAGLPVIASSVGCIPEMITNGYNGYVYNDFNVETILSYVQFIFSDDEAYLKFSSNCKAKYHDKYARDIYRNKLSKILEHVMKSNHS